MTTITLGAADETGSAARTDGTDRYRLHRAGILNVWQYDDQEFTFAAGRLLLRGANGAGKSKTLEMLLPFALDGDKARITASAQHHTSLLWLMTDGFDGQARVGYVWVEFLRERPDGATEAFTCGVGIRASASNRSATAWHFATDRRVGHDLFLEDDAGPLSRARLEEALGAGGQVFEKSAAYKEHIGRALFGLDAGQYDEVLRLLYWLRRPQVGEDIEPAKLAHQLSQALPQLDEQAVRSAGDTFDELTAFGEQIERRSAAAEALTGLAAAYAAYAGAVVAERARDAAEALRAERKLRRELKRAETTVGVVESESDAAQITLRDSRAGMDRDDARLRALDDSPEARDQRKLSDLADTAGHARRQAEHADEQARRQAERHRTKQQSATRKARAVAESLAQHAISMRDLDRRQRESVPDSGVSVPAALDGASLDTAADAGSLSEALDQSGRAIDVARAAVRRRAAAVTTAQEAAERVEKARRVEAEATRRADDSEQRWEAARRRLSEARRTAEEQAAVLITALGEWAGLPTSPAVALPAELTPEVLDELPAMADAAAAPVLEQSRSAQQLAATRRDNAAAEIKRLTRERAVIEAERDPAPPPPALGRTDRHDGHALWQVVDFADDLLDDQRAGLEAALQASGLLDAWVRPGGRLLDADQRDVVLTGIGGSAPGAATLNGLLRVDIPTDSDLAAADLQAVLAAIAVSGDGGAPDEGAPASLGTDGTWHLGPANGRAAKDAAQYIGATARAAERARRLAALDIGLAAATATHDEAAAEFTRLADRIAAVEGWLRALPSGNLLRKAWAELRLLGVTEQVEAEQNRAAQEAAQQARTATARARDELDQVARAHDLPTAPHRLAALVERLRDLDTDLRSVQSGVPPLVRELRAWAEDLADLERDAAALADAEDASHTAAGFADRTQAELEASREAVGASVRELEAMLEEVRGSRRAHKEAAERAEESVGELKERLGEARGAVKAAARVLTDHLHRRAEVLTAFAALAEPPGLLAAASVAVDEQRVVAEVAARANDDQVPPVLAVLTGRLARLSTDERAATTTRVWRSANEASSGPAADHQPMVLEYGELLAVTGRDDAGEAAIVSLAQRVTAAVESDRGLLTKREKEQFEQHVLGELGDAIRRCRQDAATLVESMNKLLGRVTTSQGIRVRLDWKLRDDVPAEAREAVELLAQPVGALLPEERATLRDVLHRLIEASRAERPELSYGEHLAAALDYRTWSEFTIRYTRPEKPGAWEKLHRRSPLSQGEQKVLCYLPLFAAAAAHFTSLAGAAPHAPRLVLLDDAFPKIDVRTHPLLFGLLVQLDLDFVITSERLWGDHDTVPALAIYEALRDPSQRGIAQYEYRWDGRALHAIG